MAYVKKINILARKSDVVEKTLEDDLTTLKTEFEQAKKTGSSNYLEKLLALMTKEKNTFEQQRPEIEQSIQGYLDRNGYPMIREDVLLWSLGKMKPPVNAHRKGGNTIEFLGGKFTRAGEDSEYVFKGSDEKLLEKIKTKYNKKQYDQDIKKLNALDRYFIAGEQALKRAIEVRDKGTAKKLIQPGSEKLKPAKILAFNQLPGLTCPGKADCFNWCFALSGMTAMPTQMKSYAENLGAAERDDFVDKVDLQIKKMKPTPTNIKGTNYKKVIRIHAYGDFHTPKYVNKWREITKRHPECFFYAYTKSFYMEPMKAWMEEIKNGSVTNVKIIQSHGSKFDDKIDPDMPHAKVFDSLESLKQAKCDDKKCKYAHCEDNDIVAADPKNKYVLILKHGSTPCAAGFCPYKKTTASVCQQELPLIHSVDQIDMPHHMTADQLSSIEDLGPHLTASDHVKGFGKHIKPVKSLRSKVADKYTVAVH